MPNVPQKKKFFSSPRRVLIDREEIKSDAYYNKKIFLKKTALQCSGGAPISMVVAFAGALFFFFWLPYNNKNVNRQCMLYKIQRSPPFIYWNILSMLYISHRSIYPCVCFTSDLIESIVSPSVPSKLERIIEKLHYQKGLSNPPYFQLMAARFFLYIYTKKHYIRLYFFKKTVNI